MDINSEDKALFLQQGTDAPLGLIATEGGKDLCEKINQHLALWMQAENKMHQSFVIDSGCPRFASGDSKGVINSSVRGKDLYFIVDMGNYGCEYEIHGRRNIMSPDDHLQDLKRLIQATSGKADRINVIMPLLYGGRQHKRNFRESLDCSFMLQELQNMGVKNILAFDAHDARVQNAVPLTGFDNVIPYYQVIKKLLTSQSDIVVGKNNFMIVSPDEGAMGRNMYYASVLGVELGMYYKLRDYSKIINGTNPILKHEYLGSSVVDKDIFITDDIISSGQSMLNIAYDLKAKGASRIFCYVTYPLFTDGMAAFDKAYEDGIISGVFGTNASFVSDVLLRKEWFTNIDISKYMAYIIALMNNGNSMSAIIDPHIKIKEFLAQR